MASIVINRRFHGPPNSGNGGYVCGRVAAFVPGDAEVTLRAPPPLDRPLDLRETSGGVELLDAGKLVATAHAIECDIGDVPRVDYAAAEDAVRRTPYDEHNHDLPTCFVCGPSRGKGDGLRIFAGPAIAVGPSHPGTFAATWVPDDNLAGEDGRVAPEFVWAALDCPTGYCSVAARHLGMNGDEAALLGRMSAHIERRPHPGDRCVVVAWPTGRDGRKLHADSALLDDRMQILATARTTWLVVERNVQRGDAR